MISYDPNPTAAARRARGTHSIASRGIVLAWCLWLLGSWAVLLGLDRPVAAVRGMVMAAMLGLTLVWPLVRLSQDDPPALLDASVRDRRRFRFAAIVVDWLSLMLVFQAVVWPLRVTGDWGLEQTLWIDAAVAAWSLMIAAIVAIGVQFERPLARTLAMLACVMLLLAEPVAASVYVLNGGQAWTARLSPIGAVWSMSGPSRTWRPAQWQFEVASVAVAALLVWLAAAVLALGRQSPPPETRTDA